MSRPYIPQSLRRKIAADAHYRCGYCLTAQEFTAMPMPMAIEHIIEYFTRARRRWVLAGWHPPES